MWPDRGSNPEPLTYESGVLSTALCGPAIFEINMGCALPSIIYFSNFLEEKVGSGDGFW